MVAATDLKPVTVIGLAPLAMHISRSTATAGQWDEFAGLCGCSYRCLFRAAPTHRFSAAAFRKAKRFDIVLQSDGRLEKVGQCALVRGFKRIYFSDQIQLLPAYRDRWTEAMEQILAKMGRGCYVYGSEWMLEAPREADLRAIAAVSITAVKSAYLEVVDFSNWPSWERYSLAVSRNVVRNAKRFETDHPSSPLETFGGSRIVRLLHRLTRMKLNSLAQKSVIRFPLFRYAKDMVRIVCLFPALRWYVSHVGKSVAGFALCATVGVDAFYLEGASQKQFPGAGWYVLLGAIRDAFVQSEGKGLFVMGPVSPETLNQSHWIGLQRSREQCRVTRRPVATVAFDYRGGR